MPKKKNDAVQPQDQQESGANDVEKHYTSKKMRIQFRRAPSDQTFPNISLRLNASRFHFPVYFSTPLRGKQDIRTVIIGPEPRFDAKATIITCAQGRILL